MSLSWSTVFQSNIMIDDLLVPNTYNITIVFDLDTDDDDNQRCCFDRIKELLHVRIDAGLFINMANSRLPKLDKIAHIGFITLPADPTDEIVAITLLSKFNAITEGNASVSEVAISSALGDNILNVLTIDDLPYFSALQKNEVTKLGNEPWWNRADAGVYDILHKKKKGKETKIFQEVILWEDVGLGWGKKPKEKRGPAQIIPMQSWKPKVIDGGKNEP